MRIAPDGVRPAGWVGRNGNCPGLYVANAASWGSIEARPRHGAQGVFPHHSSRGTSPRGLAGHGVPTSRKRAGLVSRLDDPALPPGPRGGRPGRQKPSPPRLAPERTILRQGGTLINLTDTRDGARSCRGGRGPGVGGATPASAASLLRSPRCSGHPEADTAEYWLLFRQSGYSVGRARFPTAAHCASNTRASAPASRALRERRLSRGGCRQEGGLRRRWASSTSPLLCMQPRALQGICSG